jgi:light-regulated signal transduction histidine kinase (bacteriophytochrome)
MTRGKRIPSSCSQPSTIDTAETLSEYRQATVVRIALTDSIGFSASTAVAHGLGIGLSISRSIIESHKVQRWARANGGPGAPFGFFIPCALVP